MNAIREARNMSRLGNDAGSVVRPPWMGLSRQGQFCLVIYGCFPLVAGFISAMQGAGRTTDWPLGFRLAYYLPLALVVMWSSGLCCLLLSKVTRFLRLPLWVLLIAGALLAGESIKFYVEMIVPIFDQLLPQSALGGRSVDFNMETSLRTGVPTILTWLGLNLVAWFFFKIPRFGYQPPSWRGRPDAQNRPDGDASICPPPSTVLPTFARKAGLTSVEQIDALEAQQHYLKIHGNGFEKTVLYRFSDAVSELQDADGMQVHRSWWVRKEAIDECVENKNKIEIRSKSGLLLPVSRTYGIKVREFLAQKMR